MPVLPTVFHNHREEQIGITNGNRLRDCETMTIIKFIAKYSKSLTWVFFLIFLSIVRLPSTAYANEENTYNILLVGADRRDESWNGNSDTMVLVTANYDTQQIYLTSFMRDLYADVPGHGVHKLNYAYAVGGASKLMETLETNYNVRIDNYISVDFVQMAKLVDLLGGVDLYVQEAEIPHINKGASWMQEKYGIGGDTAGLYTEGYQHLNGVQTVSFCRIRYVGNNDYERTERQRRVLIALREKTDALSLAELETVVLRILEMTDNDVGPISTVKVLRVVKDARNWEQIENRVPYDGMFTSQNEILTPTDMGATISKLRSLIYGENPTATWDYSITAGNDTDTIVRVQEALNTAGFDCGEADGYLGGKTAQAIVDYQAAHGLEQTGMIDQDLLNEMGMTE